MKILFTSIFSSLFLMLSAQQSLVGVDGTLTWSYRNISTDPSSGVQWIVDSREDTEVPIISFTSGLSFNHRFKWNGTIHSGITYSRYGYKITGLTYIDEQGNISGTGDKIYEYYDYIGVPMRIGYSFRLGDKWRLNMLTGAEINFFVLRTFKADIVFQDGSEVHSKSHYTKDTPYDPINVMSATSLGVEYSINDLFTIQASPIFRYALIPISDAPISEYPFSIGINAGFYYKLGNK